jgi:branched-subunit amino acid transport protein
MQTETLWLIVLGCGAATFAWRFLGVLLVRRIDANGAMLIFRMVIMPESELAGVPLVIRIAAVVIAFAAYFLFRRRLVAGVLAGGISLSTMVLWFG